MSLWRISSRLCRMAPLYIRPLAVNTTLMTVPQRCFSASDSDNKKKPNLQEVMDYYAQYEKEYEQMAEVKMDVEEEEVGVERQPIQLPRGETGVFDLPELVEQLRLLKAVDICVIKLPAELRYADHMVIAGCLSGRHLNAMSEKLYKIYKAKRADSDPFVPVEGKENKNWRAVDMGNIVLHLMDAETRERYDLETLWTVGSEFDDKSQPVDTLDHWASLLQSYDLKAPPKVPISKAEQRKMKL